ncbi:MAG: hypothetical protein ACI9OJ_002420 [Myxococcota bacterium]|jgi:hypothetical protein
MTAYLVVLTTLAGGTYASDTPTQAGLWAAFSYVSDGKLRVCRGDTRGGTIECVSGTGETTSTGGNEPPLWRTIADVPVTWFRFSDATGKAGSAPSRAGRFAFFTYASEGAGRVCVGNTSTGQAICASGTATWATARGVGTPDYRTDPKRVVEHYRFFDSKTEGTNGTYAFTSYSSDGAPRVCRMTTATSETLCVGGTLTWSRQPALQPKPRWRKRPGNLQWFRYFKPRR